MIPIRLRWAAALILASATGCGMGDGIKLVPVIGTVTRGGKPVSDASLSFIPDSSNKPSTAGMASTDATGYYSAKYETRSSLAPGSYQVLITLDPSAEAVPDEFKNDPMMTQFANAAKPAPGKAKAATIKTSFPARVDEKGGTFDFDLGRAASSGTDTTK